jgi:tetratricopeptide (TPR) repeat protein
LIETQEWAAAEQTLQRLKQAGADPLDVTLVRGRMAEARGQWEAASEAYRQALVSNPRDHRPLTALIGTLVRHGQGRSAESRLRRILAEDPRHPAAHGLLADLLLRAGREDEAASHYKEAVAADPRLASAWLGWATLKRARGLRQEALDLLTQAQAQQAAGEDIDIMAASLLTELGRSEEAMKRYEEILARNPRSVPAANNLASLLVDQQGDPASLAKAFSLTRDFERASSSPPLLDTAGWVRVKMGHVEEGIRLLSRAVKDAPAERQFQYHLGYAYYKSGKPELAGPAMKKALAGGPPFPGEEEARALLAEMTRGAS